MTSVNRGDGPKTGALTGRRGTTHPMAAMQSRVTPLHGAFSGFFPIASMHESGVAAGISARGCHAGPAANATS